MNILTIENDIVAKLQAEITTSGVTIESFPRDPQSKYPLYAKTAAILVRYQGSSYEEPVPNVKKTIVQNRSADWAITVLAKGLTGHTGVYTYLQQVRQALTGYTVGTTNEATIAYSSVMYPVRDAFVSEDAGTWEYEMIFRHQLEEVNSA